MGALTVGSLRRALFPQLSLHDMRRSNLVAAAKGLVAFKLGTSAVLARLSGIEPAACHWRVGIQLDRLPLAIHCSHPVLSRVLRALDPALTLDSTPSPALAGLLIDALFHPLLAGWQQALGCPLSFVTVEADIARPQSGLHVEFTVGGQACQAALVGADALDRVLTRWPPGSHPLTTLQLKGWLELGASELPLEIVTTLQPGDAVIVGTREEPMTVTFAEAWGAPTRRQGNDLVLLAPPGPLQAPAKRNGMSASGSSTVETLPVRLEFSVGQHELTIAELRKLQAGSIVPVGRTALELVEISVNGRRVGTGELVDVEGAMAVRITTLFGLD